MKNMKKKKGFTLIELIVVIAILAIIAVLAIPSFNGIKESAAKQVAAANARSVYSSAMAAQAVDNDGAFTLADYNAMVAGSDLAGDTVVIKLNGGKVVAASWNGMVNGTSTTGWYPDETTFNVATNTDLK